MCKSAWANNDSCTQSCSVLSLFFCESVEFFFSCALYLSTRLCASYTQLYYLCTMIWVAKIKDGKNAFRHKKNVIDAKKKLFFKYCVCILYGPKKKVKQTTIRQKNKKKQNNGKHASGFKVFGLMAFIERNNVFIECLSTLAKFLSKFQLN